MATVVNREAPYSGLANLMAMRGRMGDTELVHMSPSEIKGLASLGQLTVNPDTGLPEAFKLKNLLPTAAGIAASIFIPGGGLLVPALATGATSAIVNKDLGRGLFDGLLSYAGGSIMKGLSGTPVNPDLPAVTAQPVMGGPSTTAIAAAPTTEFSNVMSQFGASPGGYFGLADTATAAVAPSATAIPTIPVGPSTQIGTQYMTAQPFEGGIAGIGAKAVNTPLTPYQAYQQGAVNFGDLSMLDQAKVIGMKAAPAVAGMALEEALTPEPYQQPELISETVAERKPRTLTRTPLRSTPVTEEEALAAATGTGPGLRFSDYTTTYDTPTTTPSPSSVSSFLNSLVDNRKFSFVKEGGLVGLATGGGIPAIQEAGDSSNDPQSRGTGIIGGVNITEPIDMGLGMFNPSPLGMGLGLVGTLMGVPGLGLAAQMIDAPSISPSGQVQAYGYGNQSFDQFDNPVGSYEYTANTLGYDPNVPDQSKINFDYVNVPTSDFGAAGADSADSGSGDQGDTGVGHGAGEGTADGNPGEWATGGLIAMLQQGGLLSPTQNPSYFEGMVPGTAHGMKDNVAFKVQGGNIDTAMLSPGEYVVPADVVSMLGNGNGDSGAKQLDAFAKGIRQKAFGTEKQQKQINAPQELGQLATA